MKVLIADDHALFRDGLGMRLEQIDPNVVILQASSFGQALKILDQEKKIDLVVLDLDMPDMPWEEGLGEMRKKAECARFVVVSASEDVRNIRKVLESGVCGYIPKRSDSNILSGALKLIDGRFRGYRQTAYQRSAALHRRNQPYAGRRYRSENGPDLKKFRNFGTISPDFQQAGRLLYGFPGQAGE